MEEETRKEPYIGYKIMPGHKYRIFKTTFNEKNYYKIQVSQKNYDETVDKFYKAVTFPKGVELDNETDIIINKAFENLRANPKDNYNPISTLMIVDYEIVERQEEIEEKAYEDYRNNTQKIEDDDVIALEAELPF